MDEYRLMVRNGYWIEQPPKSEAVEVVCYRVGCDCMKTHPLQIRPKESNYQRVGIPVPSRPYPYLRAF